MSKLETVDLGLDLAALFCSTNCCDTWSLKVGGSTWARKMLYKADKGVCQGSRPVCNKDEPGLKIEVQREGEWVEAELEIPPSNEDDTVTVLYDDDESMFSEREVLEVPLKSTRVRCQRDCMQLLRDLKCCDSKQDRLKVLAEAGITHKVEQLANNPSMGTVWEADHIIPVALGGGQCGLENYQTLCVQCHQEKTTREARERAERRQSEKARAKEREKALKTAARKRSKREQLRAKKEAKVR